MNHTKFFALALLTVAHCASANVNLVIGKMTPESICSPGKLELSQSYSVIADFDASMRIEAQLIDQTDETAHIAFTFSKKNETGEFVVYATPDMILPIQEGQVSQLAFGDTDGNTEIFVFEVTKAA